MHRMFVLCMVYAACSPRAIAQELIPRLGFTASTARLSDGIVAPGYSASTTGGAIGGVEIYSSLHERIGLSTEVTFIQKGWSGSWEVSGVQYEDRFRMNYLDLAVLPTIRAAPFYAMLGPSLAIGLNGHYENKGTQNGQAFSTDEGKVRFGERTDPSDVLIDNRIDLTATFVAGMIIAGKFFIDLRYQRSFVNFFDAGTSMHSTIQLTTGIRIADFQAR